MFANERVVRLLQNVGDVLSRENGKRGAVVVLLRDRANRGVVVRTAARRPRITTGLEIVLDYKRDPVNNGISRDKI